MRKVAWALVAVLVAYVVLALLFDAYVGYAQPTLDPGVREGVLHSFDAEGGRHETRLAVIEEPDGTLWVQSGHHFRGWYWRILENPEVELERGGERTPFLAVPVDTPEGRAHMVELLKAHAGEVRFRIIRLILLFAEIKPVRLDPR